MNLSKLKADYKKGELPKTTYIEHMAKVHTILFDYSWLIRETDFAKIEITSDAVLITTKDSGVKMLCMERERRTAPFEILNFGYYEKTEMEMMLRLVKEKSVFFDIGANVGWYTINIAKLVKGVRVFAFEPIQRTFNILEQNIKLNDIQNAAIFNFGLSNKEACLPFYYYPEGSGNASMENVSGRNNIQQITTQVRKLDNFVAEEGVCPDFIKCDVEGAELLVFRGGEQTISEFKPVVFTEMLRKWSAKFNYHPNELIQFFSGLGYQCFAIRNGRLVQILEITDATVETNFFFLRRTKHASLYSLKNEG